MSRILDAIGRLLPARSPRQQRRREAKASAAGSLIAWEPLGQPVWSPRDYAAFAREGFMQNAIVYRSVRMIAAGIVQTVQAVGGLVGTLMTIYGRVRATKPLAQRSMQVKL